MTVIFGITKAAMVSFQIKLLAIWLNHTKLLCFFDLLNQPLPLSGNFKRFECKVHDNTFLMLVGEHLYLFFTLGVKIQTLNVPTCTYNTDLLLWKQNALQPLSAGILPLYLTVSMSVTWAS